MSASTVIESRLVAGAYDLLRREMIIEHPQFGRLLLAEGFGGGDLAGQCYRFRHGAAAQLQPTDTFAILDKIDESRVMPNTFLFLVLDGADATRPVRNWSGQTIAALLREVSP